MASFRKKYEEMYEEMIFSNHFCDISDSYAKKKIKTALY